MLLCAALGAENCHWREIELCQATVMVALQGDSPIPTNEDDLTSICDYIQEANQCMTNYTDRCTTPMVRELMDVFMGTSRSQLSEFCTAGTELRANFLQRSECLAEVYPEQRPCFMDLQATIEKIVEKSVTNEDRLPTLCWKCLYILIYQPESVQFPFCAICKNVDVVFSGYNRFYSCVRELIEPRCGSETVEYANQMFEMMATTMPRTVCTNFRDDRCDELLPEPDTQPEGSQSKSALARLIGAFLGN
ncbi:hypothetical protein LAZ67_8003557 [Cordylochernes scorpioides]|uniref:Uncharacterized protein n=1 Tax=Cordylochernes scorpioides TaxID=51811 RepID=A0ABY6KS43_9ARAC|nr:hypothetical protein LAZ67_8003557 [Cordylochernes scorpioides]